MWWSRSAESYAGGGGGSVDRDGGSGCDGVELGIRRQAAAVDSDDRDGGSGCDGVKLGSLTKAAAVDASTETAAVVAMVAI